MSMTSKPLPKGWPRLSVGIVYRDPAKAIDWLCKAFGFEVQIKVEGEGGQILHSELVLGGGLISLGSGEGKGRTWRKSPLDVGGANLKAAHQSGDVATSPFEVWKRPEGLAAALAELARSLPEYGRVALTMTAELCDCFRTKADGVLAANPWP